MEDAYAEIQDYGAELLAISVDDISGAQRMQQTVGASYPILADPTRATVQAYGVATPATLLVDVVLVDADGLVSTQVRRSVASILDALGRYKLRKLAF